MTVIRVRELAAEKDESFDARISFGDDAEYRVRITNPGGSAVERRLAWYFEEHLRYPFLDKDLEAESENEIAHYGAVLFGQVFGGDANHDYRNLRARSFDGCRFEVSGSAAFHRLHWEALRDPDLGAPLSVRVPVTRRVADQPSRFDIRGGRATLNILVVTARPDGPQDVGYRTISRPLLDALRTTRLPATVDLVRPGTWQALVEHLRLARERHGSGWYHVVHFDVHGAFRTLRELEQGRVADRLWFSPDLVAAPDGRQGFLFFETGHHGQAEPVPAGKVAELLAEHRVPVALLNACQSAMQAGSEAGLAQQLAQAGVPVAVGMAYSVTVSAAEQFMPVLYRRIADGQDLATAVTAARRYLADHPARQAYFGQDLDLADWMLPVMFGQRPLRIQLRAMGDAEQARFYERQAEVATEPVTEYGFVGRDLDVQAIEHRLLAEDSGQLLVQGMAGAGKSTLLRHLDWWWQRTGLVDRVFAFSYEDRAWTAAQILRDIRAALTSPADHARADAWPETAQAERTAALLRATRHLVILDNAESITAAPAAIPHSLSTAEQAKLREFLARLRGGQTLVLLGSRESEEWLTTGLGPDIYPLHGLDPQAASLLADKVLARNNATRWLDDDIERQALQDLADLLGGYPLPLTVVLPVLAATPPSQVLAELRSGDRDVDPAGVIVSAIEYSHGKLDPALQNALQLLAPFTAVIPTGRLLDRYHQLLDGHAAIGALGPVDLTAALDQAVSVGLAAEHPQLSSTVQVQPVLPWFLRSRLAEEPALRDAANQAHYQLYREGIAPALVPMMEAAEGPRRRTTGLAIAEAEYANLRAALAYALGSGQPSMQLIVAIAAYLGQTGQHDVYRELLDGIIATYPAPTSLDQRRDLAVIRGMAGFTALDQHRLTDAQTHYQASLQLFQALGDRHLVATTYHQLGMVAYAQRRLDDAEASYREALNFFLEIGDRQSAARPYAELARVLHRQQRFSDAEAAYCQALDILLEFDDRYAAAGVYHQLGLLAQEQQQFDKAEANHREALNIRLDFGDWNSAASTYHGLGILAQEQRRFDQAESNYRKALDIKLKIGARHSAALTFGQLGLLAIDQARFSEAEANFRKAHAIFLESDPPQASATASRLAAIIFALGRHSEAIAVVLQDASMLRREMGKWGEGNLRFINEHRAMIDASEYEALVTSVVPDDLVAEFASAMRAAAEVDKPADGH